MVIVLYHNLVSYSQKSKIQETVTCAKSIAISQFQAQANDDWGYEIHKPGRVC